MSKMFAVSRIVVPGMHKWTQAPESVGYLRNMHRHLFYIYAWVEVSHDNREVEFITLGQQIKDYLYDWYGHDGDTVLFGFASCEHIARRILDQFSLSTCAVYEDDENGAEVEASRK